jgi:hypothetical protein
MKSFYTHVYRLENKYIIDDSKTDGDNNSLHRHFEVSKEDHMMNEVQINNQTIGNCLVKSKDRNR